MGKRTSQLVRSGRLSGAHIRIGGVFNDGLREYVNINNHGTAPQPLGGWRLMSLRGASVYVFPADLILLPGQQVMIHSGAEAPNLASGALVWTHEQIWNNRGDVALLFDAEGHQVHYYRYGQTRKLASAIRRPKRLMQAGETWQLVDDAVPLKTPNLRRVRDTVSKTRADGERARTGRGGASWVGRGH